jgi:anti-sigma factor RsiW
LLPWYVNKTLQDSELKAVEAHLGVCLACKRELMQLQKLAQAVKKEGALDSAEQASFMRLKMRLHGQAQPLPQQAQLDQPEATVSSNVKPLGSARKQRWARSVSVIRHPALAMAAAILLSVALLMPRHVENDAQLGNNFRTLSDAKPETVMNSNEIRVVFAENVNQAQKDKILGRIHGQVIDNPTAQGVYTVRLNSKVAVKGPLDAVELLRKDSNVIFAEPAYALLSSMREEKSK